MQFTPEPELAFNKSVRQEAIRKFAQQGLHNVEVETAHSLAYRHVMRHSGYQLHENGATSPTSWPSC